MGLDYVFILKYENSCLDVVLFDLKLGWCLEMEIKVDLVLIYMVNSLDGFFEIGEWIVLKYVGIIMEI